ncbi:MULTISPECIES: efflux transporter outer membrane subunit [Acidobacteriaceae]|uniref:efflux transporter outer membrane subunit n=1 Tax=Acidobacteriaceae TaxID=204434 RepID=UPI00131D0E20|nr:MULTISPECIES: efflux transporter outer membrane subunit [Acidobacteriaceae]MDW5267643.1 efflux transporter outer membrane subunit [Edaphobacter sp.]
MTTLRFKAAIYPAIAAAVLLTGCRVGPKYHTPPATAQAPPISYKESPTQFKDADGWKVAQPQDAMLHGKWWEIYSDPELNALEDQVNINNQNLKEYFQNFMAARAMVREARSQLFPTASIGPAYTRSRSSANLKNSTGTGGTSAGAQSSLISMPLDVSWEPDLWGKIRDTISEAQFQAQISAADLENERLTEQADLAEFFFELRGQDALQALYTSTIEADKKALDLARARYETGVDDQISVVEAQNTLQSAESDAMNLGVARAQYEHAIAVLIGTNPSTFSIPVKPLNATPPAIPIGVPSQLLERRPDIAASERAMAVANAEIDIAYAAFYPDLTLSASGGFNSSSLGPLFDWPSRFWSIGPSLSETILDVGLRSAGAQQYRATYNASVATYRETVLTAFQQVEDYLASVRILSQQILKQQEAVQSSQRFVDLETERYKTGIDPYVDVVTAQTTLLTNQRTLTTLQIQSMTSSVQLVQALGGGWDRTQLPTPSQVTATPSKADTAIQR